MDQPRRGHYPPSRRHGGPHVTPCPWAPSTILREPKTRHSLSNQDVTGPPLPCQPADGLPFLDAGYCMAHDALKRQHHGYNSAGGTVPRLVEGGGGGTPLGHHHPNQHGPCRRHPVQINGIRTSLAPPPTPTQTQSQILPLHNPFLMQAPSPPPAPARQAMTPA